MDRLLEANRELAKVTTNLWITEHLNARNRSKFDYKAAFEQLRDAALPIVQMINNADESGPSPRS